MALVVMTVGIPGSGKSHLKEQLEKRLDDLVNIEPDDIRREVFGDVNEQRDGHKIFKIAEERALDAIIDDKTVYFNAMNISFKNLVRYKAIFPCKVIFILMEDSKDLKLCQKRVATDLEKGKDRSALTDSIIENKFIKYHNCIDRIENSDLVYHKYDGDIEKLIDFINVNR